MPLLSSSPRQLPLVLLLAAYLPLAASADEIYRWVDADGKVHFGATPPAAGNARAEAWQPSGERRISVLPELPPAAAPARRSETMPAATAATAPSQVAGVGPEAWRRRARAYRERVADLERAVASVEESLSFPSQFRNSMSQAVWEEKQERRLESLGAQLEQAEDAADEFEADAQQQGVPASWLD